MLQQLQRSIYLVAASVVLSLFTACVKSVDDTSEVPITTSSPEARKLFLQARVLSENLRGVEAQPLLEKAVALDSNFLQAHLLLTQNQPTAGAFFASLDRTKQRSGLATEPERWLLHAFEAQVDGDPTRQEETLKRLVAAYPKDERVQTLLGNLYFGQQRWSGALAHYALAVASDSAYSPVYNQLGYAYRFLDSIPQAERAFRRYIQLVPKDPNPYDSYAEFLLSASRYEDAVAQYHKALEVQPSFAPSFLGAATALNYLGRYDEARSELQRLYDQATNDGLRRAAFAAMAVSYVDQGEYESALAALQKQYDIAAAVGDYASMSGDANLMGNVLLEMERFDEAQARFEESVVLQEKAPKASESVLRNVRLNLDYDAGRVAAWRGNIDQAKDYLRIYQPQAEAGGNRFQLWAARQLAGIIALKEQNWDEAIALFSQTNQQNPYNFWLLGRAFEGKGAAAQMKAHFDKALGMNLVNNMQQSMARRRIFGLPAKV